MLNRTLLFPAVLATLGAGGCLAVDASGYEIFEPPDGGGTEVQFADSCFDDDVPAIPGPMTQIPIDTRSANASFAPSCNGSAAAAGHEIFIPLEVTAGEYWHFHLASTDAPADGRNPALYVVSDACNPLECANFSNRCPGNGEEHFAFIAPSTGRFYLGIDDTASGGGTYVLNALRPECGDGTKDHGEACDDGMHCDDGDVCDASTPCDDGSTCAKRSGDGCDTSCRTELSVSGATEAPNNDNPIEASLLRTDLANPFIVNGSIGGTSDCYPDVHVVRVLQNQRVSVSALQSFNPGTGVETACSGVTNTPFTFHLASAGGSLSFNSSDDGSGCPSVTTPALTAGEYFITLEAEPNTNTLAPYWMRVEILD